MWTSEKFAVGMKVIQSNLKKGTFFDFHEEWIKFSIFMSQTHSVYVLVAKLKRKKHERS